MTRLDKKFAQLREQHRTALIPYITAGFPRRADTVPMLHALVGAGADVLELGMPFSDPMADGPVIQKAGEAALRAGMTLAGVLGCVADFRRTDDTTPVVLMGYLNPLEAFGYQAFATAAAEAGVDGLLIVDLPPEESAALLDVLSPLQIAPIFLLAPTSDTGRIQQVAKIAKGYVYYVSLKGVTGSASLDIAAVEEKLLEIREHISLPVGVGFGIRDAATAAAVARVADAAVVGTVLVSLMTDLAPHREQMIAGAVELIGGMRAAMDQVQYQGRS